jgi:hypothetical protein
LPFPDAVAASVPFLATKPVPSHEAPATRGLLEPSYPFKPQRIGFTATANLVEGDRFMVGA